MSDYNLGTASGRIVVDGSGAELGFNVARTAANAFFDVVKQRVDAVQSLGRKLAATGATGVLSFAGATKVAADFEQQMSGVYAVANANEEQMERLRQKALDLGKSTVFSASESAQALEELVKAGIPLEDILSGAADAATALAAAGGVSIPEAATIAANAMNQFGLSGKDVAGIADTLAGVANTSAADVSSLGTSLAQAGAVANLAGLDFKDTAIALGEMADAGIQGSDAGTSLKTMLNNLIPTTDKQKAKFKELGILTYDLKSANEALRTELGPQFMQKNMKGVNDALAEYMEGLGKGTIGTQRNQRAVDELLQKYGGLRNAFFDSAGNIKNLEGLQGVLARSLKGLTREQKLSTLETLFGADAMRASAILSLEGAKGYREFNKAVEATSAADVAKTRLDNLKGAQEQFTGALETAAITIGSVFLPILTKIVQGLTVVVNAFNNLPPGVQKAIAIFALVASSGMLVVGLFLAMLPLLVSMLVNFIALRAISGVVGGFKIFFTTLRAGTGTMAATRAAALTTGGAFQKLTARMLLGSKAALFMGRGFIFLWTAITGPIGIAIAAIVALVAIGVLLYKKWEPFRNLIDAIAAALMSKMMAAWGAIKAAIPPVLEALSKFGNFVAATLLPVLKQVGQELLGKLLEGWKQISQAVTSELLPALQQAGDRITGDLLPALSSLWSAISPVLAVVGKLALFLGKVLLGAIMVVGKAFITYVLPILIKVAGFIFGVLIDAIVSLIKGIIDVVTGIIKVFTGLIDFIVGVFTGDWGRAWEGIKSIVTGLVQAIWGVIQVYLAVGVLKLLKFAFAGMLALVRAGWSGIRSLFAAAGSGIWNIVKRIFTFILNIIKGQFTRSVSIIRGVWNFIKGAFQNGNAAVIGVVRRLITAVLNFFRSMGANVVSAVLRLWNRVISSTRSLLSRLQTTVKNMLDRVITFFKELPGKILDSLKSLGTDLYNMGRDIIQGMINGVKSMAQSLANSAKDVVKGAIGAAKDLLHIGSPSKLFEQFGKWTIQGEIQGQDKEAPRLAASAAGAAQNMVEAYMDVIKNAQPMWQASGGDYRSVPAYEDTPKRRRSDKEDERYRVATKKKPGASGGDGQAESRLIRGVLRIDKSGRAWIEGIAEDVVAEAGDTGGRWQRMG